MKKLTKEQILLLHHELIKETGGTDGMMKGFWNPQ